ncbi:hypothetical protein LR48_Vigan511s008900 [Vigna angularis]|uniref:Uncharacterized protein n=2 Tax=Phaseolus angularis TaxID=3914 RepID=A0A0L9TCZ3_PHAAN|nr:hypothetical protein LR48_Vigan511s008900 [Vigna angularis]BAT74650.1 hypothetical protein VIGAN_01235900 [Vigna angularis var. angularis]
MGKNTCYPSSQKGHKKSSSNSSSSGKHGVHHSRTGRSSYPSYGSRIEDDMRSTSSAYSTISTFSSKVDSDIRSTGFAYSRISTFSSRVNRDIRSNLSRDSYYRIYSRVDDDTRSIASTTSRSSLGSAPAWSSRVDSYIRSNTSKIS